MNKVKTGFFLAATFSLIACVQVESNDDDTDAAGALSESNGKSDSPRTKFRGLFGHSLANTIKFQTTGSPKWDVMQFDGNQNATVTITAYASCSDHPSFVLVGPDSNVVDSTNAFGGERACKEGVVKASAFLPTTLPTTGRYFVVIRDVASVPTANLEIVLVRL